MATSLPAFINVSFNITLTSSESSATAISAIPTTRPVILHGASFVSGAGSPDGKFELQLWGAQNGSNFLGDVFDVDDMDSGRDVGTKDFDAPRFANAGVWYTATGDGDSNGDDVVVSLVCQLVTTKG